LSVARTSAAAALDALLAGYESRLAELEASVAKLRTELARRDARGPALEPLNRILGVTAAAARMREARDKELRALAVVVGRRRRYDRQRVLALLEERGR
jgi:hypothetical protein